MNKYTVTVKADTLKKVIPIPPEFDHKEVRLVISPVRKKKFDPRKYRGIGNTAKEEIDKEIQRIREEWDNGGR